VIVNQREFAIISMNFYSGQERLLYMGDNDKEFYFKSFELDRVESFEIAADEQLVGAELFYGDYNDNGYDYFLGVTWLKCKIAN
jgi:hypothetical protein